MGGEPKEWRPLKHNAVNRWRLDKNLRLRVAVAGHDASVFARYPAEGTPVLTVQRNNVYPFHLELPMMVRE
jgi:hypothetical protein